MPHAHHASVESAWISAGLILAALIYLRGWLRVRSLERDSVGAWRAASFILGMLSIWVATASPWAALDHDMLTAHMVQHLMLMTFAPLLILLGLTVKPMIHGPLQRFLHTIGRPLRSAPI